MRTSTRLMLLGLVLAGLCRPEPGIAAPLGLSYIRQLIADKNIGSVEELLSNLPTSYRSRFALMFFSRSLQAASYERPRVILYGPDAKFVLTFNGDSQDRGFDSVEMMEFDDVTKQFFFQEATFRDTPNLSDKVAFSPINSEKCTACHGAAPRPVWDAHPLWPGAYGEQYQARPSRSAETGFESFVRHQPEHPRYRYLTGLQGFAYRYQFKPNTKEKYDFVSVESPNAELTNLLGGLNAQSIAAMLISREDFPVYRYVLLGSLSRSCTDIDEFFPDELQSGVRQHFRAFSLRSDAANQRLLESKAARAQQRPSADRPIAGASIDPIQSLTSFRFVAEFALGLDSGQWTLGLEKGTYDFTARRSVIAAIERTMIDEVARGDPDLQGLRIYESQTSNNKYCAYLARQSRAALAQAKPGLLISIQK